jgi:hypothetical protein
MLAVVAAGLTPSAKQCSAILRIPRDFFMNYGALGMAVFCHNPGTIAEIIVSFHGTRTNPCRIGNAGWPEVKQAIEGKM